MAGLHGMMNAKAGVAAIRLSTNLPADHEELFCTLCYRPDRNLSFAKRHNVTGHKIDRWQTFNSDADFALQQMEGLISGKCVRKRSGFVSPQASQQHARSAEILTKPMHFAKRLTVDKKWFKGLHINARHRDYVCQVLS